MEILLAQSDALKAEHNGFLKDDCRFAAQKPCAHHGEACGKKEGACKSFHGEVSPF